MKMKTATVHVAILLSMFLATLPARAQDSANVTQNKLLARRAAEADAYRKLAETINGFRLTSETFVRDFVTESDTIQAEMDTLVRSVRLGQPTYYDDGLCEVSAEVTVAQVITQLREIHTRHYRGDRVKGTDFENIRQSVHKDVIHVIGQGAPRPDLPPGLPAGVEQIITQVIIQPVNRPTIPEIWKTVPVQERLKAERAATLDAQRKLLERIRGLRLNSDTLVKDFITQYDEIRTHASDIVVGAREIGKYHHSDELMVEVTLEVPVESVITQLKTLHTRHYHGDHVHGTDIETLRETTQSQTFQATGCGVPDPRYIVQQPTILSLPASPSDAPPSIPDWVGSKLSANGQATDPNINTPQGRLKAARAAELEARRLLMEQVQGLPIRSDTRISEYITQFDEVHAQLNGLLVDAVVESTMFEADVAHVTVSVAGMEVWSVINDHLQIIARH